MKKIEITIIFLIMVNLTMAQRISNLNILLNKNDIGNFYLIDVEKTEFHFFYTQDGRSDIQISYGVRKESADGKYMSTCRVNAHFIPQDDGRYIIEETNLGCTHYQRPNVENAEANEGGEDIVIMDIWVPGIRETSPQPQTYVVGYSTDTACAAVIALKYFEERRIPKAIYKSSELDDEPAFMLDEVKLKLDDYVMEKLRKRINSDVLDSLSGSVYFSYVIEENGWISDVKVDSVMLNKPEHISEVCVGINHTLIEYHYTNDHRHKWVAGRLNGVAVAAKQQLMIEFKPSTSS